MSAPAAPGPGLGGAAATAPQRSGGGLAPAQRKRLTVLALILAIVLVVGAGAFGNLLIYTEHEQMKQLIAGYEQELSRLERIRGDIIAEHARRDELHDRSDVYYGQLPDMAAVPDIVGQIEEIAAAVGGDTIEIRYIAPEWDGQRGVARLQVMVTGGFDALARFLESVTLSVPALYWESFDMQPVDDEGEELLLFANVRLDLFRKRAEWAAPWQPEQTQLVERAAAVNAFGAPLASILLDEHTEAEGEAP